MTNGSLHRRADIIIPVHNQFSYTRGLLEGIYRYSDVPFHIWVIDNASTDETGDLDKIYARDVTVVRNRENRGWAAGINQGIQLSNNPYVVVMSNVVEVSHNWIGNLLAFLDTHPLIGAVGPLNSDGNAWQGVDRVRNKIVPQIPYFLTEDLHERNRILQFHFHRAGVLIDGLLALFCAAFNRRTINVIGPLDEALPCLDNETDYSRRLRKTGYVLGLSLDTYVIHHSNHTSGIPVESVRRRELRQADLARLKEKHPAYF